MGTLENPRPMFGDPVGPWHWHFAWWPVRTYDQRFVWLRWVERRCIQKHQYLYGGADFWWQYRTRARITALEEEGKK